MARRPDGFLESEILAVLWRADAAMTPGDVRGELPRELAYTTVMTVLARLYDKGLVRRSQRGRAFAYEPVLSESELAAQRMGDLLAAANDRAGALSGFVGNLAASDARLLRRVLRDLDHK